MVNKKETNDGKESGADEKKVKMPPKSRDFYMRKSRGMETASRNSNDLRTILKSLKFPQVYPGPAFGSFAG